MVRTWWAIKICETNKQKKTLCGLLLISVMIIKYSNRKKRNYQSIVTFWAIGNKHTQQNEWNVKCLYIYTIKKKYKMPTVPVDILWTRVPSPVTKRITMNSSNNKTLLLSKNRKQYLQYLKNTPLVKIDSKQSPEPLKNVWCQTSATIARKWLCFLF